MKRRALWIVALSLSLGTAKSQETLPPGNGQQLVLNVCVQCHDLRWIVSQHKSESGWRHTVNEMIWRGAPLMPGDIDVITKYLATMQPVRAESQKQSGDPSINALPPGAGRSLVIAACVQCHDLALTVSQHKTLAEWRRSVEQMAHLGARLNGREVETVAQFLAGAFGPEKR